MEFADSKYLILTGHAKVSSTLVPVSSRKKENLLLVIMGCISVRLLLIALKITISIVTTRSQKSLHMVKC